MIAEKFRPMLNEGIKVEEVEGCLLCDSKGVALYTEMRDRLFDVPGVWSLFKCPCCSFVWLNPRPTLEDVGKTYAKPMYTFWEDEKPGLASLWKKIQYTLLASAFGYDGIPGEQNSRWIGKALGLLPPLKELVGISVMFLEGSRKGRLLDVGCGNGKFLARMRDLGWKVLGIEPDSRTASVAQERFKLSVIVGTLEKAGLPFNSFDAVTMSHIIEHVHNPIGLLEECKKVLKQSGRLVIVTPNIESLGHRVFQESWYALEPPRHLYLFSLGTLKACVEMAGFKINTCRTLARSSRGIWSASRLIRINGKLPGGSQKQSLPLYLEGLTFQVVEHGLKCWNSVGEELLLVASKR